MMKKNIWIFNHYATNSFFNRGGRHYWFAEQLLEQGFHPVIFCANVRHSPPQTIPIEEGVFKRDRMDDIPYVFVKTTEANGNGVGRIKNMAGFYRNLFPATRQYLKESGKPDVILASSVHPLTMVAGIKIARKLGIPCICEVRDLWPEAIFAFNKAKEKSLAGRILTSGEHWIYKHADALIFTKEGDTDYIREKKWDMGSGGDIDLGKAHYINNGVDIEAFNRNIRTEVLKDADLEEDKFNVVYVGAIRPVNDLDKILDGAALLKEHSDIQFLIFGDGSERQRMEERVAKEQLRNVKIKGHIDKKYIPYILSRSSVNILNYSQTQYNWARGNSSNKLFEYMASGKPVISTVKMGYSILDKYSCGFELEDASAEALADTILKIKQMPEEEYLRLSENARAGAQEFDFKVLTGKLIDVIHSVLVSDEDHEESTKKI